MKSIEEIKEDRAKECLAENWIKLANAGLTDNDVTEVAERYSQQYIDENNKLQSKVDWQKEFIEKQDLIIESLKGGNEARKQFNKELLNMLEYVYNFSKGMHFHKGSITDQEITELITKYKQ